MTQERAATELVAVVTAVTADRPVVLTAGGGRRLPAGPLHDEHRSMQAGLSAWVEQQTGHRLGYVEQLYTFADPDRSRSGGRVVSVSYLGLTFLVGTPGAEWRDWYSYFPWEDHRPGADGPGLVADVLTPRLQEWSAAGADHEERARRGLRTAVCLGLGGRAWSSELVLQRYELLYEAGLLPEGGADPGEVPGVRMDGDHRRILSTGLARLRAKIQYHPVVFELVPDTFTLGQLQSAVEALAGQALHKQNFRRLVTQQDLVEPTGGTDGRTGGRPARLYRFRREVLDERQVVATKLPRPR
ncbi:NUDIX hydrolase [Ornithinimicrobium avium]|uniref:NrtR DNA-binding winged helix domain-containing protein n=1 Tax=Ornithinimicrobium avium TaxID=2283195 RepID=A0A345NIN9_9MICO|nr:hypothetical protein [Ornithinimicrobium avium]AXH94897.1 hypothetical protein DV701_00710 [Ornithinimicrobium avium]